MPRPLRCLPGGFVYHIVNRANDRQRILQNEADFEKFTQLLLEATARTRMRVCAYCLMQTHWHLVLWPYEDQAVSAYLHWVTTCHSLRCRRRVGTVGDGHVYQGRFRSFPVETSGYYYNVVKYVEANPLRAALVRRAEDWRWSSVFERVHGEKLITDGPLELPDNWIEIVNADYREGELEAIRESAANSRPYGASGWIAETAGALGLPHIRRPRRRNWEPAAP